MVNMEKNMPNMDCGKEYAEYGEECGELGEAEYGEYGEKHCKYGQLSGEIKTGGS